MLPLLAALALSAVPANAGFFPGGAFSSRAAGTTSAVFLKTPGGARASAMGGVSAAAAAGAEAVFLNPAALSRVPAEGPSEVAVGYDALLESSYAGSVAYARPAGRDGAFGAGLLYASQGAQTAYNATGDATGKFSPTDLALGAWYARRLAGPLSLGGGLKVIRAQLDDRSGMSAALDFGLLAKHVAEIGDGPFDAGLAIVNIGPPLKLGATADPLPARIRAGGLWHLSPVFDAGLDINVPVDQDPYASLGVEGRIPASQVGSKKPWILAIRAGYDQNRTRGVDGLTGFAAGAGFDFAALRLDYAWLPFGDLGTVNRITLAFRF